MRCHTSLPTPPRHHGCSRFLSLAGLPRYNTPMSKEGYVNYFEILGVEESAKPGEVRNSYKRLIKNLLIEIARTQITEERRAHFLLEMAKLNAGFYILRDNNSRNAYWEARNEVMSLEDQWRQAAEKEPAQADQFRRGFDSRLRHFLSRYVEEAMLEAGRDPECVEHSNWDAAHERHASSILRHYRHTLYQHILERLPYHEVTPPRIDWTERQKTVSRLLDAAVAAGRRN